MNKLKNYATEILSLIVDIPDAKLNDAPTILKTFAIRKSCSDFPYYRYNYSRIAEEKIASALYEGYKQYPNNRVWIREFFADHEYQCDICVENGTLDIVDISPYGVVDLDMFNICETFEAYKSGTKKPVPVEEDCYSFIDGTADGEPVVLDSKEIPYWLRHSFLESMREEPEKYPAELVEVFNATYGEDCYYRKILAFERDMVNFPDELKPKKVKVEDLDGFHRITAQIGDKLYSYDTTADDYLYDRTKVDFAGAIIKKYVDSLLADDYKNFINSSLAEKVYSAVETVEHIASKGGKVWPEPIPELKMLAEDSLKKQCFKEGTFGEVMSLLLSNNALFSFLEEKTRSRNSYFFPWFKEKVGWT